MWCDGTLTWNVCRWCGHDFNKECLQVVWCEFDVECLQVVWT